MEEIAIYCVATHHAPCVGGGWVPFAMRFGIAAVFGHVFFFEAVRFRVPVFFSVQVALGEGSRFPTLCIPFGYLHCCCRPQNITTRFRIALGAIGAMGHFTVWPSHVVVMFWAVRLFDCELLPLEFLCRYLPLKWLVPENRRWFRNFHIFAVAVYPFAGLPHFQFLLSWLCREWLGWKGWTAFSAQSCCQVKQLKRQNKLSRRPQNVSYLWSQIFSVFSDLSQKKKKIMKLQMVAKSTFKHCV